jgi:hypothetical protein
VDETASDFLKQARPEGSDALKLITEPACGVRLTAADIMITSKEIDRFEEAHTHRDWLIGLFRANHLPQGSSRRPHRVDRGHHRRGGQHRRRSPLWGTVHMAQFSVKITPLPGSLLSGNQQLRS